MEVGGEPVNHSTANTLPFEEAVSHLRGAGNGTVVTRKKIGETGQEGWSK